MKMSLYELSKMSAIMREYFGGIDTSKMRLNKDSFLRESTESSPHFTGLIIPGRKNNILVRARAGFMQIAYGRIK